VNSKAKGKKAKKNLKRDLYRTKVKAALKAKIPRKPLVDINQGRWVYHKIHYVRYADDYLIAVKGPKSLALEVKKATENFLKSSLHFYIKGGELVHAKDSKVSFLGFDIKVPGRSERDVVENSRVLSFKKIRNRLLNRKNMLEGRFTKALSETYDLKVKQKILALSKNKDINRTDMRNEVYNEAFIEASQIKKLAIEQGIE